MNHINPYILDLAILCVVIGLGYIATAIAYGIGYKDGKRDGTDQAIKNLVEDGYIKPPF